MNLALILLSWKKRYVLINLSLSPNTCHNYNRFNCLPLLSYIIFLPVKKKKKEEEEEEETVIEESEEEMSIVEEKSVIEENHVDEKKRKKVTYLHNNLNSLSVRSLDCVNFNLFCKHQ